MNGVPPSAPERAYINVMESLVAQEVGQQFQAVPARIRRYLRMEEVVTYALNRLPALYASSEKGWQCQRQLAKRDLHRQIKDAVRQAIMAVQVDPLRLSQPLQLSHNEEAEAVLQALRAFFQIPDLDWPTALKKLTELKQNSRALEPLAAQSAKAWQPGSQPEAGGWTHRQRRSPHRPAPPPPVAQTAAADDRSAEAAAPEPPWGWDNVMYRL